MEYLTSNCYNNNIDSHILYTGQSVGVRRARMYNQRARRVLSDNRLDHGRRLWQVRRPRRQRARQRFSLRIGGRRRYNIMFYSS